MMYANRGEMFPVGNSKMMRILQLPELTAELCCFINDSKKVAKRS